MGHRLTTWLLTLLMTLGFALPAQAGDVGKLRLEKNFQTLEFHPEKLKSNLSNDLEKSFFGQKTASDSTEYFVYANANPTRYTDPDGMFAESSRDALIETTTLTDDQRKNLYKIRVASFAGLVLGSGAGMAAYSGAFAATAALGIGEGTAGSVLISSTFGGAVGGYAETFADSYVRNEDAEQAHQEGTMGALFGAVLGAAAPILSNALGKAAGWFKGAKPVVANEGFVPQEGWFPDAPMSPRAGKWWNPKAVYSSGSRGGDVFHATEAANSVLGGIDPKYLNPNARFGRAFYVTERPDTALAELAHYDSTPTHGIRFSVDLRGTRVLDLTDSAVAARFGYTGGPITPSTQSIGAQALEQGFSAIRYPSLRGQGANLAVLRDFNQILRPEMVTPTP